MFLGEYRNKMDNKGRIAVPFKLRDELGSTVVLNRYLDGCLAVYTLDSWNKRYEALMALPSNKAEIRKYQRSMTAEACETDLDSQGRILVPDNLIRRAQLTKECVFIGAGDHVELWPLEKWESYNQQLTDEELESIAESLQ
ncbi:MAG: division/cell wall cluster transcriptional repressor MraZ [Erysipelotrichaceae bacterium]|nr:division/cell wall cluster transcriptional repressor MraZ [Erysipelotrichaceae bacterium]